MIALDSNLLIYAHREELPWHAAAYSLVERLAESPDSWAIPWPCVHEFLAVVTNPRVWRQPTPFETALDHVAAWRKSPSLSLLSESEGHWERLSKLLREGRIAGAMVHDARIAAICLDHGVAELWSADRDFSRFPALRVRNPLVG